MNDVVLSLADKREVLAEAKRLYAEAVAYDQLPYEGYCFHGTYVGGCMEDWLCGYCESGELGSSHYDYLSGSFRYSVALQKVKGEIRKRGVLAWVSGKLSEGLTAVQTRDEAKNFFSGYELWLAEDSLKDLIWQEFKASH